jgi:hypothetical protein
VFGVQVKWAEDVDGSFRVSVTVTLLVNPPPVTVTVALLVPTAAVAVFTLTVTVPLLDPEVGLTVNQSAFLLTVHDPLEVTVTDWLAGSAAPWVAVNERLVGFRLSVAVVAVEDAVIVKFTGISCGVLVAPDPVTVMVEEYVPAVSPPTFAAAVKDPGAVPETGDSESHGAVVLTPQLKVPVPELLIVTVCAAGLLTPSVAENARVVGFRLMVGTCEVVMVSVITTVCGVFVAPDAATVMGVE